MKKVQVIRTLSKNIQLPLSKQTLSKADRKFGPYRIALLSLCNWSLSKVDTSLSRTADTLIQNFGKKTSWNGHQMYT